MNPYDEVERGLLSPALRKCIEDVVTGRDLPCRDVSIAQNALENVTDELAVWAVAMGHADDAEAGRMLSSDELHAYFGRFVVRARAVCQLAELLEMQPDEATESGATQ